MGYWLSVACEGTDNLTDAAPQHWTGLRRFDFAQNGRMIGPGPYMESQ